MDNALRKGLSEISYSPLCGELIVTISHDLPSTVIPYTVKRELDSAHL